MSRDKPYAGVICRGGHGEGIPACGKVGLTQREYDRQMDRPDRGWHCPRCGGLADFDDERFEELQGIAQEPTLTQGGGEVCAHHWHDYGQMNVSWCHKCEAKAVTGYEHNPFTAPPSAPVGVSVDAVREYLDARACYEAATRRPNSHAPAPALKHGDPVALRLRDARVALDNAIDLAQQPAAVDEGVVVIDGRRYAVETVRTALLGLAADVARTLATGDDRG